VTYGIVDGIANDSSPGQQQEEQYRIEVALRNSRKAACCE
jgi:hypothetical protein